MSKNVCSVRQEEVLWWFSEKVEWVGFPTFVSTVFQGEYSKTFPQLQPGNSYFSFLNTKEQLIQHWGNKAIRLSKTNLLGTTDLKDNVINKPGGPLTLCSQLGKRNSFIYILNRKKRILL